MSDESLEGPEQTTPFCWAEYDAVVAALGFGLDGELAALSALMRRAEAEADAWAQHAVLHMLAVAYQSYGQDEMAVSLLERALEDPVTDAWSADLDSAERLAFELGRPDLAEKFVHKALADLEPDPWAPDSSLHAGMAFRFWSVALAAMLERDALVAEVERAVRRLFELGGRFRLCMPDDRLAHTLERLSSARYVRESGYIRQTVSRLLEMAWGDAAATLRFHGHGTEEMRKIVSVWLRFRTPDSEDGAGGPP